MDECKRRVWNMDINASKDFIVTELGWERICLNFTIQANYEGEIKFQLRRFNRKVKVEREPQQS